MLLTNNRRIEIWRLADLLRQYHIGQRIELRGSPSKWTDQRQHALLENVLCNYPMGSLVLWHSYDSKQKDVVIDGNQRIATLVANFLPPVANTAIYGWNLESHSLCHAQAVGHETTICPLYCLFDSAGLFKVQKQIKQQHRTDENDLLEQLDGIGNRVYHYTMPVEIITAITVTEAEAIHNAISG
jgi:hypothetical protein